MTAKEILVTLLLAFCIWFFVCTAYVRSTGRPLEVIPGVTMFKR